MKTRLLLAGCLCVFLMAPSGHAAGGSTFSIALLIGPEGETPYRRDLEGRRCVDPVKQD